MDSDLAGMTSTVKGLLKSLSATDSAKENGKNQSQSQRPDAGVLRALDGSVMDEIKKSGLVELTVVF